MGCNNWRYDPVRMQTVLDDQKLKEKNIHQYRQDIRTKVQVKLVMLAVVLVIIGIVLWRMWMGGRL